MSYSFFSTLSRLKYINRWGLMNNTRNENLSEHSLEVAFIAHALCIIKNKRFGGSIVADKVAVYAMFHDCTEIITGDLPTPKNTQAKNCVRHIRLLRKKLEKDFYQLSQMI